MENQKTRQSSTRIMGVFSLVMITVGSVDSIRNLPATALFGSQLLFFFVLATIFFLIPAALLSAELASTWPDRGGVYAWVKRAFGDRIGFVAIWLQWIENVIWYPTILSFVAGTLGYLIAPSLAANKFFLIGVILAAFWGATIINLFGMKSSARFSALCTISGLILPMLVIIGLGSYWIYSGRPLQINFNLGSFVPELSNSDAWVALTGIMLSFCGIEIATVHAGDVKNPQRAFPRALAYSVAIIVSTLLLGALAIAIVIPQQQISLVSGIMEAFSAFLTAYHLQLLLPLLGISLVLGGLGSVSNWIIAPTKGLMVAAEDGFLPEILSRQNRYGAPYGLLILQALIVTGLSSIFLLMPSVNGSYWFLTALGAQLYMLMYILMFIAASVLRHRHPHANSAFKIPGNLRGVLICTLMGTLATAVTLLISFIPPGAINVGLHARYVTLVSLGLILLTAPPILMRRKQKNASLLTPGLVN